MCPCLICSGLLHDYFGNYTVAFSLAGVPPMMGGVVLFFVPLIHRRLQQGQEASPEETSTTAHMLPTAQPVEEPKSCSNGDILPGYTDVETHIWVAAYKGNIRLYTSYIYTWKYIFLLIFYFTFVCFFSQGFSPPAPFLILRLPSNRGIPVGWPLNSHSPGPSNVCFYFDVEQNWKGRFGWKPQRGW